MKTLACLAILSLLAAPAWAHSTAKEMAEAAKTFLGALDDSRKSQAQFSFEDGERFNWHFIPRERKGLPVKAMSDAQRALAFALMSTGLSDHGYRKATSIMSLEQVLFEKENQNPTRDPGKYYLSIFGEPDAKGTWGWRLEGHHLSLNYLVVKGTEISVTPAFFGTNPGEVREGPRKGLRVLGEEEDLGRKLARSLNEEQKKVAIFDAKAPEDIITKAERKVSPLSPVGITCDKLGDEQKAILQALVRGYLAAHEPEIMEQELKRIESEGWGKVAFAWAGGLEPGEGHYYRVQGQHFLLEYDNTQNGANHAHLVWRDFTNDFGEDILLRHLKESH